MTAAWAALAGAALAMASPASPPQGVLQDDQVRITGGGYKYNAETGVFSYENGVIVDYGPTKLTAERVSGNARQKTAKASGNVLIVDPEGTIQATDVDLKWAEGSRRATARDVHIQIAGARLQAKSAELTDALWVFSDIDGTTCRNNTPLYSIHSPRLEIVPGKSGRVIHPRVSLFGKSLLTLPTQKFNLDSRVKGIRFPNIAYRRDQGLGVAWSGQFLLNEQTAGGFDFGAFRGGYPTYSLGVSKSYVPAEKTTALITPRDDLGDRFNLGYFDDIELDNPETGYGLLSNRRSTLALLSQFNRGASIGPSYLSYSKPVEFVYEGGGNVRGLGTLGQIRVQNIRNQDSRAVNRVSLGGTALSRVIPVGRGIGALGTLDAQGWLGGNNHGWARGSAGLVYQPARELTLGAAGFYGKEVGQTDFPADSLYTQTGYSLRADLKLGGFRGRYMVRYDTRLKWFDREYSVNQVFGCLEAFLIYRQYPQNYQIGVTLRVDQFVGVLTRRKFERTQPIKRTVISEPK
ncbi:hypothetical protein BH11ARM2_BH11ARM2_16790 [soil metagenome]